jgi:thiol:disulfide interchange protein
MTSKSRTWYAVAERAAHDDRSWLMLTRRIILLGAALAPLALFVRPALAFEGAAFDAKTFEDAQRAGKSILIDVHAGWCAVCWVQQPILSELIKRAEFKNFVRFTVEFDMEKDVLKRFGATRQSTLIVFKGTKETGRSIGDTSAANIEKLLRTAL